MVLSHKFIRTVAWAALICALLLSFSVLAQGMG
jgi:hypothetical protein